MIRFDVRVEDVNGDTHLYSNVKDVKINDNRLLVADIDANVACTHALADVTNLVIKPICCEGEES